MKTFKVFFILMMVLCANNAFSATLAPFPQFCVRDTDGTGPLSGGKVYTYETGTTTPKTTYTDSGEGTPNTNPVILDSDGCADIWFDGQYRVKVDDSSDVNVIPSTDNVDSLDSIISLTTDATFLAEHTNTGLHEDKPLLSSYNSCDISNAVSTIGATETTLQVDCNGTIADGTTVTIPSTLTLEFLRDGQIDGTSGGLTETLTVNGGIIAEPIQIFGSNLALAGTPKIEYAYYEWGGAVADGSTDNTTAFTLIDGWFDHIVMLSGVYVGTIDIDESGFVLEGQGPLLTTVKTPNFVEATTIDLSDVENGNSCQAYTDITLKNFTIDGNRTGVTQPSVDIYGWGLLTCKISQSRFDNLHVKDCFTGGISTDILSSYNDWTGIYVYNSGDAATLGFGGLGFDVNSSDHNNIDVEIQDCDNGMRVLDNSDGNIINATINNADHIGLIFTGQVINAGNYGNNVTAFINGGIDTDAVQVSVENYNNIFNLTIKDSGAGGLYTPNTGAGTESIGNIFNVAAFNGQTYAARIDGDNNIFNITSFDNGRSGAAGTYYDVEVEGDNNQIVYNGVNSGVAQSRGIRFNAGATDNILQSFTDENLVTTVLDSGTRTKRTYADGLGTDIASAAGITIPEDGTIFNLTGTTSINQITACTSPRTVTLKTTSTATLFVLNNIKINGHFYGETDRSITMYCDGTDWFEVSRTPENHITTSPPAGCIVGQIMIDTDSDDCADTGGGDGAQCICKTTNTWALLVNY